MSKKIVVIGSLNMDYRYQVTHLPKEGETLIVKNPFMNPGGKGANQAIAVAKMMGDVTMIGAIGHDADGTAMIDHLNKFGVNTQGIIRKDVVDSGKATILVDEQGLNMIIVSPGANYELTVMDIKAYEHLLLEADYCLLQLEVPMATIEYVIDLCHRHGVQIVLNPAPFNPLLTKNLLSKVDYLLPNETELSQLTESHLPVLEQAQSLISSPKQRVIVTLGEQGSLLVTENEVTKIDPWSTETIDTTAAGDSYIGAFLAYLAAGHSELDSLNFASKVASITVSREGASESIPTFSEVE